jgi:hypothetical protein
MNLGHNSTHYGRFKFKLQTKNFPYWIHNFSSRYMHFYGTCPSIICTHSTSNLTHTLDQVWTEFYAQILVIFSLWAKPTKYHPHLLWTLKWFFNFLYWNGLISTIYYPFPLQSSSTIFHTQIHTSYYSKHWIAWILPILALNNWISLGMSLHL